MILAGLLRETSDLGWALALEVSWYERLLAKGRPKGRDRTKAALAVSGQDAQYCSKTLDAEKTSRPLPMPVTEMDYLSQRSQAHWKHLLRRKMFAW